MQCGVCHDDGCVFCGFTCQRCKKKLNNKPVWLELSFKTSRYYPDNGECPEDESQGLFSFGSICAEKALQEGAV